MTISSSPAGSVLIAHIFGIFEESLFLGHDFPQDLVPHHDNVDDALPRTGNGPGVEFELLWSIDMSGLASRSPDRIFINVDFPQPLGPVRPYVTLIEDDIDVVEKVLLAKVHGNFVDRNHGAVLTGSEMARTISEGVSPANRPRYQSALSGKLLLELVNTQL